MMEKKQKNVTFVLFGSTGDLAKKKIIPALNGIAKANRNITINLVAVGRREFDDDQYKKYIGVHFHQNVHATYYRNDFSADQSLSGLKELLHKIEPNDCTGRMFYLATSPEFFGEICAAIAAVLSEEKKSGSAKFNRILLEKPFGTDQKSSRKLNDVLEKHFEDSQIFRVDHYLAKETVQNLLILRLSNPLYESTWNSKYIDRINITVEEDSGVENRLEYYDATGAIRDMLQNHLLQVASLLMMDAPKSTTAEDIHEQKYRAIRQLKYSGNAVIGQYESYNKGLQDASMKPSKTETFVMAELESGSGRWKGTKIILRTGKKLGTGRALIEVEYKKEPCIIYCNIDTAPNRLVLHIQPKQDIEFYMNTKTPGKDFDVKQVKLDFCHDCEFESNTSNSYERIIDDCIEGDRTLFISDKELDAAWRIVDKMRKKMEKMKFETYKDGSEGPKWSISK